ncbi:MAG TPA: hypothetical protein VL547_05255 [Dinghuibacter sp.]|jgi:hypothetical protein|uniref:hypothetical protein n=1 Tax=Dinghuibacter sp. TaxID=2024697 RepID=UPI002CBE8311|nr:hypothetical protein [Dinghuibacter sp.]HTJ11405.1 hypothetical protein [Dinghuibacter sp.]
MHGIHKINTSLASGDVLEGRFKQGITYLTTEQHGNWTTVIEIAVNLDKPFYLYDLTNGLSKRLNTYALSFHLHDGDVLLYNLDKDGEPLDGYNSDYQYFLEEPAELDDMLSQRHSPQPFKDVLPPAKNVDHLNAILNEGYWKAFDDNALDEDGVCPEEYFVDEEERFERVGKYLEIFSNDEYPFANWQEHRDKLQLDQCILLTGEL